MLLFLLSSLTVEGVSALSTLAGGVSDLTFILTATCFNREDALSLLSPPCCTCACNWLALAIIASLKSVGVSYSLSPSSSIICVACSLTSSYTLEELFMIDSPVCTLLATSSLLLTLYLSTKSVVVVSTVSSGEGISYTEALACCFIFSSIEVGEVAKIPVNLAFCSAVTGTSTGGLNASVVVGATSTGLLITSTSLTFLVCSPTTSL